jgi:hypothetical protein
MKSARLTLLTTPEFKAFLGKEAIRDGVSVAELVRTRCLRPKDEDEAILIELNAELKRKVRSASVALDAGLAEANAVIAELRANRQKREQLPRTRRKAEPHAAGGTR